MTKITDSFCPKDKQDWRKWLKLNHKTAEAIWLIVYKKGASKSNLTWSESVDEALCFGWIDSLKKTVDKEKYQQFFTKRKPNSTWSKINKEKVDKLLQLGLIADAGLKTIELAKQNGSWEKLDKVEALEIPEDLEAALKKRMVAFEYFNGLSNSAKKSLLHWIVFAKRPETRQKRIMELVESAGQKLKPKPFR